MSMWKKKELILGDCDVYRIDYRCFDGLEIDFLFICVGCEIDFRRFKYVKLDCGDGQINYLFVIEGWNRFS